MQAQAQGQKFVVGRPEMNWCLHRLALSDRERLISKIDFRDDPQLNERNKEIATDYFVHHHSFEQLFSKYGPDTQTGYKPFASLNSLKMGLGEITNFFVGKEDAQNTAKQFLQWSASLRNSMSWQDVRRSLQDLVDSGVKKEVDEIIDAIPDSAWKIRAVMPEHRAITKAYLEDTSLSERKFIESHWPDEETRPNQRMVNQVLTKTWKKIADEPTCMYMLERALLQSSLKSQLPGVQDLPETHGAQSFSELTSTQPLRLMGPVSKQQEAILPKEVSGKPIEKPIDGQGSLVSEETVVKPTQTTVEVQTQKPKPKKTKATGGSTSKETSHVINVDNIESYDDFQEVLRRFAQTYGNDYKKMIKDVGFEHVNVRHLFKHLPAKAKGESFMDQLSEERRLTGHSIPWAIGLIHTQPVETIDKVLDFFETSLEQSNGKTCSLIDSINLSLNAAILDSIHGRPSLSGHGERITALKQLYSLYPQEMPGSDSVRADYEMNLRRYRQVASGLKFN